VARATQRHSWCLPSTYAHQFPNILQYVLQISKSVVILDTGQLSAIRHCACADQTPQVVWPRGPGGQVQDHSRALQACISELEAASRSFKTYLAKDGGGRSAPIQSWSRVRVSESTKQNSLVDTHRNSNVTDKLRLMVM